MIYLTSFCWYVQKLGSYACYCFSEYNQKPVGFISFCFDFATTHGHVLLLKNFYVDKSLTAANVKNSQFDERSWWACWFLNFPPWHPKWYLLFCLWENINFKNGLLFPLFNFFVCLCICCCPPPPAVVVFLFSKIMIINVTSETPKGFCWMKRIRIVFWFINNLDWNIFWQNQINPTISGTRSWKKYPSISPDSPWKNITFLDFDTI